MFELTDEGFDEAINQPGVVLVKFYSPICGPCKVLAATLDTMPDEYKVYKVDTSQHQVKMREHKLKTVPSILVFKDGQYDKVILGMRTRDQLMEMINHGS